MCIGIRLHSAIAFNTKRQMHLLYISFLFKREIKPSPFYNFAKFLEIFFNKMSSEVKVKRSSSRLRTLLGGGRKLCDTIILENDDIDSCEQRARSDQLTNGEPTSTVVEERTERETTPIAEDDQESETTFIADDEWDEKESRQVEQWSKISWELPRFMGNIKSYMDNESKYFDENELVPVRVALFETGDEIGVHSTFLAKAYLKQLSDPNQNNEGEVNLNLPTGATYLVKSLEYADVSVIVTLKLVENSEKLAHMHYRVKVHTSSGRAIASQVDFMKPIKTGGLSSIFIPLEMSEFLRMDPNEGLLITIHCCVYRSPRALGLTRDEVEKVTMLMKEGRILEGSEFSFVIDLVRKLKKLELKGLIECLGNLAPLEYSADNIN